jgi:primosomal protein N'
MIKHPDLAKADRYAEILKTALDHANDGSVRILGPAFASIARIKNEFRIQIILKSANRKPLRSAIDKALSQAEVSGGDPRHYNIEIDPLNLM